MRARILTLLLLMMALCAVASQQQTPVKAPAPPARPAGFRGELLTDLDDVQDKITRLATAIPAEKFTWRPSPGVRSVSEVFMHIAGGNYFLATFVDEQPPADMPKDIEKVSEKTRVLTELKKSFDHLRRVIANESDADLDKSVSMFGTPSTHRHVFNTIMNHLHEHLGQSIAYARMNGIVPPWSH
ncbi:MAG: DinB family protein [Thermoanaerobaculia bacterium]